MQYYFRLQFTLFNRHLRSMGLHPVVGWLLIIAGFAGFSVYLFYKTTYAPYLYVILALSRLTMLSARTRCDFLKNCFLPGQYYRVRLTENAVEILPYVLFLAWYGAWLPLLLLVAGALSLVWIRFDSLLQVTIPTPFYRKPFEFAVGFRSGFLFYGVALFLCGMGIAAGNFNLGLFALLLVFLQCLTYYANPEPVFFVWVYALGPRAFLWEKIRTALVYATLSAAPLTLALGLFSPDQVPVLLLAHLLGYLYLATLILSKYAAFPEQIQLQQTILLGLSVWLPPLILGIGPFFYKQAVKRLQSILA